MPGNPGVSYDEVPYESQAFHETHPDHLATIARLHGLKPAAPSRSRVLELGCASGGNLIPMAISLPEARLVGVDLSARQVADGQKVVERLGLGNLELRAQSLADLEAGLGPFDFIICHGVYSWVPPAVRERILEICARNLADQGVAFISYNTYPGWHGLQMIREMMLFHTADFEEPGAKVKAVRQFLTGLTANVADPMTPYAQMIRREVDQLLLKTDSYLLHEYLEEENEPVYYHQFLESAARHGLKVVSDARPKTSTEAAAPPVLAFLESLGGQDVARLEQYMDFLRGRTFRRSLLVKQGAEISARTSAAAAGEFWAMAACGPVSATPDIYTEHPEEFRTSSGQQQITTNSPIMKAAMVVLVESWPGSVAVPELHKQVIERLERPPHGVQPAPFERQIELFQEGLLTFWVRGMVELRSEPGVFAIKLSESPEASRYARLQAETGKRVTNLLHRVVELTDFERLVILQLDGETGVLDALVAATIRGEFPLTINGRPVEDAMQVREILGRSLEACLMRLAGSSLLVK